MDLPRDRAASLDEAYDLGAAVGSDLRLPKLSHLVAGRLREQIVSGKLKPGSLLLPENRLIAIFHVSRPTLREALRILEAESLISIGRGMRSGALVLGPSIQKAAEFATFMLVAEGVTMRDLHEARMFFEPALIASLHGQALHGVVAELRTCIQALENVLAERGYVAFVAGTNRVHEAIARASGNRTLSLLVGILGLISEDAYAAVLAPNVRRSGEAIHANMTKTLSGYKVLCDLLDKGKTHEASCFWRRFMERGLAFLKRSRIGDRRLISNAATAQVLGNG